MSSTVSDFVLALLPLPTLTLMVSQRTDSTIAGDGNELSSWMTRLAVVAAPSVAPAPGDDSVSGMIVLLSPGWPSLLIGIVTIWLVMFGPIVTVSAKAVMS